MYVTWDNLFDFCTVILLVFQMMNNKEKQPPRLHVRDYFSLATGGAACW